MTFFAGASLGNTYTAAQLVGGESYSAPGIGDLCTTHDNKTYRFVKYNSGAGSIAAVAGNVAGFYAPSGVSAGQYTEVTSDVSDTAGLGAGVLQAAPNNGEYCWIQVGGLATVNTALVSGADGQPLVLSSTTDGTLKVAGAATDSVVAFAVKASTKTIACAFPR